MVVGAGRQIWYGDRLPVSLWAVAYHRENHKILRLYVLCIALVRNCQRAAARVVVPGGGMDGVVVVNDVAVALRRQCPVSPLLPRENVVRICDRRKVG